MRYSKSQSFDFVVCLSVPEFPGRYHLRPPNHEKKKKKTCSYGGGGGGRGSLTLHKNKQKHPVYLLIVWFISIATVF